MDNTQLNISTSKQNQEFDTPEALASKIWNIVYNACEQFKIPQAILSATDSDIVLRFPNRDDLKSITFSCGDTEEVIRIFPSFAESSNLEGKIFCKNVEVQLHFRY